MYEIRHSSDPGSPTNLNKRVDRRMDGDSPLRNVESSRPASFLAGQRWAVRTQRTQATMTFPRIDHPEFAEFIRRFYGVSKPEAVEQRQPSQIRENAFVVDESSPSPTEIGARRQETTDSRAS